MQLSKVETNILRRFEILNMIPEDASVLNFHITSYMVEVHQSWESHCRNLYQSLLHYNCSNLAQCSISIDQYLYIRNMIQCYSKFKYTLSVLIKFCYCNKKVNVLSLPFYYYFVSTVYRFTTAVCDNVRTRRTPPTDSPTL